MSTKKERPIIGRTLNETPLTANSRMEGTQRWTLTSGHKVMFQVETIPAEHVQERTYVDQSINGRDQSALSAESLEDITRTLQYQQYFVTIGRLVGERIEILDGSRRRAAALLCGVGLKVMYTRSELTVEDARQLAADIQTAKEHNIREIGLRLKVLKASGKTQKEIAQSERLSEAKVTRAMQAAEVPQDMLVVFPVQSELTYPDYKFLLNAMEVADSKNVPRDELVIEVQAAARELRIQDFSPEDHKNEIINLYRNSVAALTLKKAADKPVTVQLRQFDDRRVFARKTTHAKSRKISYEFGRISTEAHERIDEAIRKILKDL